MEQVKFQPRAGGFGSQPRTGENKTESAEEESAEKESAERVRRRDTRTFFLSSTRRSSLMILSGGSEKTCTHTSFSFHFLLMDVESMIHISFRSDKIP